MDDERIVQLYWDRKADAIKETSNKYGAYCFSIANHILHSNEDAEECVNDTWLSAWNAMPPHKPKMLQMFLAKITRNLAFDCFHTRTAQKRSGGEIDLVLDELAECLASESDVAKEYEYKELGRSIRQFVNRLPVRERNIFLHRYFFTDTVADISALFGLSENNVMVILSRTRKKLKAYLRKEGLIDE